MLPPSVKERYLQGEPIDLGQRTGLLIDDWLVEDRFNVERQLNAPIKHFRNPLVIKDKPWEGGGVKRPCVLYDPAEGLFRMWYVIAPMTLDQEDRLKRMGRWDAARHGQSRVVGYAESEDGIAWRKPLTGQAYAGYADTNVVLTGEHRAACSAQVTLNHPSSGQPGKFMMSYSDWDPERGRSLYLAYSDDGICWRRDHANPVLSPVRDTTHNLCYDEENERWLLYTRPITTAGTREHGVFTGAHEGRNFQRRAAVAVGKSPQTLGLPRGLSWPDETEPPDYDDFLVHRVGSHYLAMISGMFNPLPYNSQVYLAFSADGIHWNRLPGSPPFIPLGREGDFDAGQACTVKNIVEVGDEYYLYYQGTPRPQKVPDNEANIGLARIRRDRFVSQRAGADGGYLLTREVIVSGRYLVVNMTLPVHAGSRMNEVRFAVELIRSHNAGNPGVIEGYGMAACKSTAAEGLEVLIEWEQGYDLSALIGQPVMIRFFLRDVGLYSFRFASA
jgi:hypothetical protein